MKKTTLSILISSFFLPNTVSAMPVFDATNFAEAIKIVQGIQDQIKQAEDYANQFNEYQQQFDDLYEIQKIAERTSDAIREGKLDEALTGIKNTLGYTQAYIDDISSVTDIERVISDIDTRLFDGNLVSSERAYLEDKKTRLEVEKTILSLKDTASDNIDKMSKDESINESHRINATNTSILARLAVENKQADNAEKAAQAKETATLQSTVLEAESFYRKLGESTKGAF